MVSELLNKLELMYMKGEDIENVNVDHVVSLIIEAKEKGTKII